MAYLNELHPEIFFVYPRPGGIAKIEEPDINVSIPGKGSKSTVKTSRSAKSKRSTGSSKSRSGGMFDQYMASRPQYVSREVRIKTALETSPWVFYDEDSDMNKPPNPLQDSLNILAIVVTTVMLLAAGRAEATKAHLRWTLSYLENVTDESGNSPPNIRGLMNHIKKLDDSIVSYNEQEEQEERELKTEDAPPADGDDA